MLISLRHVKWAFCAKKTKYILWEHVGKERSNWKSCDYSEMCNTKLSMFELQVSQSELKGAYRIDLTHRHGSQIITCCDYQETPAWKSQFFIFSCENICLLINCILTITIVTLLLRLWSKYQQQQQHPRNNRNAQSQAPSRLSNSDAEF